MMNISLTPELERFVNSTVKRGRYSSGKKNDWLLRIDSKNQKKTCFIFG